MNSDVAEQIRNAVETRLRELRPILNELEQLQRVLALLDDSEGGMQVQPHSPFAVTGVLDQVGRRVTTSAGNGASANGAPADVTPLTDRIRGRRGHERAPQGANKRRIMAVIAEHPGIAAPQIARLTGLKRPVVASTVSRLKRTGELLCYGDGVRLPNQNEPLAIIRRS